MKYHLLEHRILITITAFLYLGCINSKSQRKETDDQSILKGEWIVSEQTMPRLAIIPRCKPIHKGSIFKFTQDKLEVYTDASGKPCDVFLYKITDKTINFIKEDMVYFCTYELDQPNLKIKSNTFFILDETYMSASEINQSTKPHDYVVTFIKKKTKTN